MDQLVKKLGDGEVVKTDAGENIFKMDSYDGNPVVKPQDIGLTWCKDGVNFERYKNVVIRGDGTEHEDFIYGIEDIRIIKHNQRYILVGTGKLKPPFKGSNIFY